MLKSLPRLKQEQIFGLIFVLLLHGMALYGLWSYCVISTPDESIILMVNLINPPPSEQPKALKPVPPRPPMPEPVEPPKPQQLVVEAPVVLPDESVAPPPPPPSSPVIVAPPLPSQPVMLSGELSVACPGRVPPEYPRLSMRMNEQGKVVLRVELAEDGRVASAEI